MRYDCTPQKKGILLSGHIHNPTYVYIPCNSPLITTHFLRKKNIIVFTVKALENQCLGEKDNVIFPHNFDNLNSLASIIVNFNLQFRSNIGVIFSVKNKGQFDREIHLHGADSPRISRSCLKFGVTGSGIPWGVGVGIKAIVNSCVTSSLLFTRLRFFRMQQSKCNPRPSVPVLNHITWPFTDLPQPPATTSLHTSSDPFPEVRRPDAYENSH